MSESDGEVKVKPPKAKKEKISRYFLTINSNRTPEQLGDEGTNEFKRRIKALFDNFHLFIQVRQGYEPDPNMTVKKLYAYEVGEHPQGGRYHCHAVVSVHHNSNVQVFLKKLQQTCKQYGWYAQNTFIQDAENFDRVKQYMEKGLPFSEAKSKVFPSSPVGEEEED